MNTICIVALLMDLAARVTDPRIDSTCWRFAVNPRPSGFPGAQSGD
jgi:hypothetical protein